MDVVKVCTEILMQNVTPEIFYGLSDAILKISDIVKNTDNEKDYVSNTYTRIRNYFKEMRNWDVKFDEEANRIKRSCHDGLKIDSILRSVVKAKLLILGIGVDTIKSIIAEVDFKWFIKDVYLQVIEELYKNVTCTKYMFSPGENIYIIISCHNFVHTVINNSIKVSVNKMMRVDSVVDEYLETFVTTLALPTSSNNRTLSISPLVPGLSIPGSATLLSASPFGAPLAAPLGAPSSDKDFGDVIPKAGGLEQPKTASNQVKLIHVNGPEPMPFVQNIDVPATGIKPTPINKDVAAAKPTTGGVVVGGSSSSPYGNKNLKFDSAKSLSSNSSDRYNASRPDATRPDSRSVISYGDIDSRYSKNGNIIDSEVIDKGQSKPRGKVIEKYN